MTGLIGICTNPRHGVRRWRGPSAVLHRFHARIVGGQLRTSSESKEVAFVGPSKLDELTIHPSMRMRIEHGLAGRTEPYIG
ncbi:DNA mismatch repair protein MutT [Streptomyces sp. NPDC058299]|uniref:DNA mismatch repair protein MutT n=1 Tax=Streptomyces sp. NPDC058299 TaxID=3346435 RepID=UPI0036EEAA7F